MGALPDIEQTPKKSILSKYIKTKSVLWSQWLSTCFFSTTSSRKSEPQSCGEVENKSSLVVGQVHKKIKLDPYWISGFSDAEACFSIIIFKRSQITQQWRVQASFEINLHSKDLDILYRINDFFGVGLVHKRTNLCVYRVTKVKDLVNVIVPHFLNYPLLTQKHLDFLLWVKVVKLVYDKQHLTTSGFQAILSYYANINRGISPKIAAAFPNISKAVRPEGRGSFLLPKTLNPFWVSGFTAGDGGFSVGIRSTTGQIYFRFHITQHSRDYLLMKLLIEFFDCGNVIQRSNVERCDFYIQDSSKINNQVVPHFVNYPLNNIKTLDFLDFKKALELFKAKGTQNSISEIKKIISNMNSKRNQ